MIRLFRAAKKLMAWNLCKKNQGLFFKTILLQNTLHERQTNECKLSQWKKLKNTCGFAWAAFRALTQAATHRWCVQAGTGTKKASMHTGKEQVWPMHSHQPTISARKSLPEYYDCAALACAGGTCACRTLEMVVKTRNLGRSSAPRRFCPVKVSQPFRLSWTQPNTQQATLNLLWF